MIDYSRLVPPQRPSRLFSRPRLLDELLAKLPETRLAFVSAPAGYGKTYTLIDLISHTGLPTCWYAISPLEQDAQRFILHFIAAIQTRFKTVGQALLAALQSNSADEVDVDSLISTLVNELFALPSKFVFILDDFHHVEDSLPVTYFLNQIVERTGGKVHFVLATRTLPQLTVLETLLFKMEVFGFGYDALAFRPGEFQQLLQQNYNVRLPDSRAEQLVEETNGWIPALIALAEQENDQIRGSLHAAKFTNFDLFDILLKEVLSQLSERFRTNLMKTALLGEFTAELCEKILGSTAGGWPTFIREVKQRNLFVLSTGTEGERVAYHQLFRSSLIAQLGKQAPHEIPAIRHRLAEHYRANQAWEEAHALYTELAGDGLIAELIQQAYISLLQTGRRHTLQLWLDALPVAILQENPFLLAIRGQIAITQGHTVQGLARLNEAIERLQGGKQPIFYWRTVEWYATALTLMGNYGAALAELSKIIDNLADGDDFAKILASAWRVRGDCLRLTYQLSEALEAYAQSRQRFVEIGFAEGVACAENGLAMVYRAQGDYGKVEQLYQKVLSYWQAVQNPLEQAVILNNWAVFRHHRGQYKLAVQMLDQAMAFVSLYGFARLEMWILATLGDIYSDLGSPHTTLAVYGAGRAVAQRIENKHGDVYLRLMQLVSLVVVGQVALAEQWVTGLEREGGKSGAFYRESGRVKLVQGEYGEAERFLQLAYAQFEQDKAWPDCSRVSVYLAHVMAQLGEWERAEVFLARAFELGTAGVDLHYELVAPGRAWLPLLSQIKHPQVQALCQQIERFEASLPTLRQEIRQQTKHLITPLPTLDIRAFGQTQVHWDGKLVTVDEWRIQRKARELFFYVLMHPAGVAREQIGLTLWPDSSPKQLRGQFGRAMEKLRQAYRDLGVIGYNRKTDRRYHFNRQLDYEYDVEEFERQITVAKQATNEATKATAFETARHLYRGDFLPDLEADWVTVERVRLAGLFLDALAFLAQYHFSANRLDEAESLCRVLLERAPLNEVWHRLVMNIYAQQGESTKLQQQYQTCKAILLKELNRRPAKETVDLYEKLMEKHS